MVSASLRFCVLLVVMFLSFSLADTPSLVPPHIRAGKINTGLVRALGADAEEVLNIGLENQKKNKGLYASKTASPSRRWCFAAGTICPCSSRWGAIYRLWIPLKRAVPVFALSGSGGFVVTSVVGGPDRGFSLLCAAACGLGSCVQLRDAV
ncbi:hypothetical protein JRO89_XS06G0056400 [Xanthoceras sorbifolium]|uniref:Uncharacterized protein n=1 Tax=Xanthoceras sorbifolium TaxID=99658 RepID=A0ABQ8HWT3_9ROSI|nr:hypothetical protein JRO89_XS06G0056400 [Xanthoceras sorbifolium]